MSMNTDLRWQRFRAYRNLTDCSAVKQALEDKSLLSDTCDVYYPMRLAHGYLKNQPDLRELVLRWLISDQCIPWRNTLCTESADAAPTQHAVLKVLVYVLKLYRQWQNTAMVDALVAQLLPSIHSLLQSSCTTDIRAYVRFKAAEFMYLQACTIPALSEATPLVPAVNFSSSHASPFLFIVDDAGSLEHETDNVEITKLCLLRQIVTATLPHPMPAPRQLLQLFSNNDTDLIRLLYHLHNDDRYERLGYPPTLLFYHFTTDVAQADASLLLEYLMSEETMAVRVGADETGFLSLFLHWLKYFDAQHLSVAEQNALLQCLHDFAERLAALGRQGVFPYNVQPLLRRLESILHHTSFLVHNE